MNFGLIIRGINKIFLAHYLLIDKWKVIKFKIIGEKMKIRITYKISNNLIGEKNLTVKKFMDLIRLIYSNDNVISYFIINQNGEKK